MAKTSGEGAAGEATTTTNAYLRKDRRDTMRYRLRRQMLPHQVLAGLWLAAGGGHAAGRVAGDTGPAAALVVALAAAAAVGVWVRRRKKGTPTGGRQVIVVLAGCGWLGWVSFAGPSWTATAVLLLGGYAASLRWWARWRIPDPPEDPAPPPGTDPSHPPRLWDKHIATGGDLPGSSLSDEEIIATGLRYACHLVPGRQTLAKALAALPNLRTGLRLYPRQDLVLERHPERDESVILVTIVRSSRVLTAPVAWPGPTYDRDAGMISLGPYVDGEGIAQWRLHTDNGLWGGFLAGSTGSGKSRTLEAIALSAAHAGCTIWYADPQGGASSPFLARYADLYADDLDSLLDMLHLARRVKRLRQAQNMINGWQGWNPDQGRNGLLIIIDECHGPLQDPRVQALVTEIAREGRKLGMAEVLASQQAQQETFGKQAGASADALRSSVCAGNMLIMRSMTYSTRGVLPGVDFDPTAFPEIPGYGFLVDHSGRRRCAPLRSYFLPDEAWDAAAAQITWPELDTASAGAAGGGYTDRRELAEQRREQLAAYAEALAAGEDPEQPSARQTARRVGMVVTAKVVPFPAWRIWQQREHTPPRRTAVEVVYDLLRGGVTSPGELEARSGYSETQVRNALRQLVDDGKVRRLRHGVWEHVT